MTAHQGSFSGFNHSFSMIRFSRLVLSSSNAAQKHKNQPARWPSFLGLKAALVGMLICGPALEAQTLTNGALYAETLVSNTTNTFTLTANSGDSLVVRVGMLTSIGFFNPWLRLFGPGGQLLGSVDSGTGNACEIAVTATNTGTF
ncbi:MAG TPA: hypothetical protein VKV04_07080, partial [Verrucomicrobiae bacterium]|nr:hypothetical protein [Verrucomicrobiae bacterium]